MALQLEKKRPSGSHCRKVLLSLGNGRASLELSARIEAPIESFWAKLKTKLTFHQGYQIRQEAKRDIQKYSEIFYNRQRKQKRLDYLSPAAYERRFYQMQKAA
jgi:transposase InsO family protein